MKKYGLVLLFLSVIVAFSLIYFKDSLISDPIVNEIRNSDNTQTIAVSERVQSEIVAENLNIPWSIATLPSGDLLVTERQGNLLLLGSETKTIQRIEGVAHVGEGGLHSVILHPNFEQNNQIYLYSTTRNNGVITNRVERYELVHNKLQNRTVIIEGIPGSTNHDGGALAFGPDGYLYITTGDADNPNSAQDTQTLNGKILRITANGSIPADNPFSNAVYSYGHRNPQSIVWDDQGRMWSTEHGPSGVQSGYDEINLIKKGANYGWPVIRGDQTQEGMESPKLHSGSSDTWAPAGAVYHKGKLYFTGLRGSSLYSVEISGDTVTGLKKQFTNEYGRLRALSLTQDEFLYVSTSNRDGRGNIRENDDKIIRLDLMAL